MSLIGSREGTERWLRERWPAIRARGLTHFLLVKGLLLWGGIMFVVMGALSAYRLGLHHPRLPLMLGIAAGVCAFGGLVWASLTWWIKERIFRSLNSGNHA